jgi:hypothetical protein
MDLTSALIRKLGAGIALCDDDIRAIRSLPIALRRLSAGESIVREGDGATSCCLSVEGFMYRSKNPPDGRRQILSVHIPGDMPDLQSLHLRVMDHDLIAMTGCTACFVPHAARKPLQDNSRTDRLIVPRTSGTNQWQPNSSANERFGVDRDTSSGADRRAALPGCPISTPC